jgi:hypothetical protein
MTRAQVLLVLPVAVAMGAPPVAADPKSDFCTGAESAVRSPVTFPQRPRSASPLHATEDQQFVSSEVSSFA